jgi:Domain of unknown function (DUF4399)
MNKVIAMTIGCLVLATVALAAKTPSTRGAEAYIVSPRTGATVGRSFKVVFGLKGMGVAPAGVEIKGTGHHHLLIDTKVTPQLLSEPIPSDEKHMHFGKGQTEVMLTLPPGRHTLQLILGDHNHIPHKPPVMSRIITVRVK